MIDFCKARKNSDALYECNGCQIIGTMFEKRRTNEGKGPGNSQSLQCIFHNSLQELRSCANTCATCRILYRALWLRQITKEEADKLGILPDRVWARLQSSQRDSLKIGVGDSAQDHTVAAVSCTLEQGTPPVNLCAERTHTAVGSKITRWLNNCHEKHSQCRNLGWSRCNPSNLIHINPNTKELKLVETSNADLISYAALSYTWGLEHATEDERVKIEAAATKKDNLQQRRESFAMLDLPDTIQDSIKLTLSLNIRHIWIDAICISPYADWNAEASQMHEVYGNAYVTLAICSSIKATEQIPYSREAWRYPTGACRLYSGHWLANVDMPLNEIRLRSPLFTRAWTLQEERLSPRMLYLCGQQMYWSCLLSQQSETGHAIAHKGLEGPDNLTWIRHPQGFLQARRNQDISGLHGQWLELVKAYIKRDVFRTSDRFRAIAGLAVQYLSPYTDENGDVKGQEYLAGLWRQTFPEDLSWSVQAPKAPERKLRSVAPAWSWASIPVCSDIATQNMVESTSDFKLLETLRLGKEGQSDKPQKVVMRGALIRSIKVCGRVRRLLSARSEEKEWALIMLRHGSKEEFDMSNFISDSIHSRNAKTGQFVAYEPNKHEIVAQLDYLFPEKGAWDPLDILTDSDLKTLMCLQIGRSSMLLLRPYRMKKIDEDHPLENPVWRYQRVGICNSVHNSFFLAASLETLYLV